MQKPLMLIFLTYPSISITGLISMLHPSVTLRMKPALQLFRSVNLSKRNPLLESVRLPFERLCLVQVVINLVPSSPLRSSLVTSSLRVIRSLNPIEHPLQPSSIAWESNLEVRRQRSRNSWRSFGSESVVGVQITRNPRPGKNIIDSMLRSVLSALSIWSKKTLDHIQTDMDWVLDSRMRSRSMILPYRPPIPMMISRRPFTIDCTFLLEQLMIPPDSWFSTD